MTVKRAFGIAAGALAAAVLLSWAAFTRRRRLRGTSPTARAEQATAPSAWGGAAVLR